MNNISIILVNYNGIKDTLDCISSILKAGLEENSIIVVDNASRVDETTGIKKKFPDVITLRSEVNGGFAAGNNLGIRYALEHGSDYIMLLNNDTVIAENMVSLLIAGCDATTITVPKMLYYSEPDIVWYGGGEIDRWTGNAVHCLLKEKDVEQKSRFCTFATGCCIMVKADVFRRIGLLDDKFFMYSEDVDFCIRLSENGIRIKYIPQAKLWHKVGSSSGGEMSPFNTYYVTRNRLNLIKLHRSYFHWIAYWYSLITRYIRMFQAEGITKITLDKAIKDHRNGVWGRREDL